MMSLKHFNFIKKLFFFDWRIFLLHSNKILTILLYLPGTFPSEKDKDFFEMIYLLDKEATEAERQLINPKSKQSERQICGTEYVNNLKNLIFYLRYGARPRELPEEHVRLLDSLWQECDPE
jgi:hypothetical protein